MGYIGAIATNGFHRLLPGALGVVTAAVLAASASSPASGLRAPTLGELVGQRLVVRMDGTAPSAGLLGRVRRGQVAGVILHRFNFGSPEQLRSLTHRLQREAAAGGRPRLLVAVDQEGGPVATVPGIPPTLSPSQLGALGSTDAARRQGRITALALRRLGINVNLAPVADVPGSRASFLYRQGRTWSFGAAKTTRLAAAFAAGLRDGGVRATMKHFPGLGLATRNTDKEIVRISATRARLAVGLEPFRRTIAAGAPFVMLSNAVYDAYDRRNGAGWSRAIATTLLRDRLGFRGVTITDSLDGSAHARGVPADTLAVRAAAAGSDLILVTGSEPASLSVYYSLVRAARDGRLGRAQLLASYRRIVALRTALGS